MKVRILCYRPDWDKHILDNLITGYTYLVNPKIWKHAELKCGHSEVWLPDENGDFFYDGDYTGTCITSTMRYGTDGTNGVVKRNARNVLKNSHRWFYFEVEIEALNAACCWIYSAVYNNKGYDKKAICSYFWYTRFHDEGKYICSEFTYEFICLFTAVKGNYFIFDSDKVPSPIRLAYYLLNEAKLDAIDLATGLNIIKKEN